MSTLSSTRYTREEFNILFGINSWAFYYHPLKSIVKDHQPKYWKKEAHTAYHNTLTFKMFYRFKLRKMPLYLNHKSDTIKAIAKWRITIGK